MICTGSTSDVKKSAGQMFRAFLLGLGLAVVQVGLFRELMAVLYGNELVFSLLLAAWTIGIAAGSLIWRAGKPGRTGLVLCLLTALFAFWAVRYVRLWLGWSLGESTGFFATLAVVILAVFPAGFLGGTCFRALVSGGAPGQGARTYALESIGFAAGAFLTALWFVGPGCNADSLVRSGQWPGYQVLAARETPYASLVVAERGGARSLFVNGLHTATTRDALTAEETVHYSLLAHPAPLKVLLIGGLASGAVAEALKYPGLCLDVVEQDAQVAALVRDLFPDVAQSLQDPRVRVLVGDGRRWLRERRGPYDVIIVAAGDPLSALAGRYYTREFFADARAALTVNGIFSATMSASEEYVNSEGRRALSGLYATLKSVFGRVAVIPGGRYIFLTGSDKIDPAILSARLKARGVATRFVRPEFFNDRLSLRRVEAASDLVQGGGEVNTDLRPLAVVDNLVYQTVRTGAGFSALAAFFRKYSLWLWVLPVVVFFWARGVSANARAALVVAGFSQMLFQVGVVMILQTVFGNVYSLLGGLLALFMLGLACGSWQLSSSVGLGKAVLAGGVLLAAAGFLAPYVMHNNAWAMVFLVVLPFMAGYCGGWIFRMASDDIASVPKAYGLDLLGAVPGALLGGVFLIPLWGMPQAFAFAAALHFAVYLAQGRGVARTAS
ncbi:MAG: hypothetical protein HQL20_02590 [Candidatus Omnitrophica bacterium]|nr:hypothetical protein [Candidatus Omnitrophota bacterium]